MAMKALPMLCIVFLLVSASLVFPSAEGVRTLEESKATGISYNPLNPGLPGRPYIPGPGPCKYGYHCPP